VVGGRRYSVGRHEMFQQRLDFFEQRFGQLSVAGARQMQVVVHVVVTDCSVNCDKPVRLNVEEVHILRHLSYLIRDSGIDRSDLVPQRIVKLATGWNALQKPHRR